MFDLSPEEWTAVWLSIRIATVATLGALPFGVAIAWLLARKNFWGKALLDGIVHLPLVLPPVVTGYLLLIWFGRKGPVGAILDQYFGIVFSFRWTGAALACGVMAFPLLVRAIRLSFEAIDRRLEDAASTLGANRMWVFLTVTLPLALPAMMPGSASGNVTVAKTRKRLAPKVQAASSNLTSTASIERRIARTSNGNPITPQARTAPVQRNENTMPNVFSRKLPIGARRPNQISSR